MLGPYFILSGEKERERKREKERKKERDVELSRIVISIFKRNDGGLSTFWSSSLNMFIMEASGLT
jgi:hypothetical protein